MTPIEQKVDEIGKTVKDFRDLNDKALQEAKKLGAETSETKAAVEKANAEITKLQDEMKSIVAAHSRPDRREGEKAGPTPEQKAHREAFLKMIRQGKDVLNPEEVKALSVGSDPDGGYLVLPEMSSEIVKKVFESSPVRQLASVMQTSTDRVEMIEDLDEASASWVNETGSRSETNTPALKKIIIAVHELYAKPKVTQKLLDDAMFNVEAWLAEHIAAKFGRTEATAFVLGDGVNKPRGFMSYAAGTSFQQIEQVVSGSAAAVAADGIINLSYALKGAYKKNASFMMKRATVGSVRKLKDSQNQYLWQPGLQAGQPDLLLGFPIYEADDIAAEGANNLVMAFGDFRAAYQIVDRIGIRTLRDPFSSKPSVEFYTTKRVGGDVKNFEALKILKCST